MIVQIFANVGSILKLHETFHDSLAVALAQFPQCIGAAFSRIVPFFSTYKEYVAGYSKAACFSIDLVG